jgi:hypothetical protein
MPQILKEKPHITSAVIFNSFWYEAQRTNNSFAVLLYAVLSIPIKLILVYFGCLEYRFGQSRFQELALLI